MAARKNRRRTRNRRRVHRGGGPKIEAMKKFFFGSMCGSNPNDPSCIDYSQYSLSALETASGKKMKEIEKNEK